MSQPTVPFWRPLLAWLLLIGLLALAVAILLAPMSTRLLPLVAIWMVASKSASLLCMPPADRRRLSWLRFIAYLLFPGIPQPRRFLPEFVPTKNDIRPTWLGLLPNAIAGVLFLYAIPALLPEEASLARILSGVIGIGFLGLFFRFDVMVLLFRCLGFAVEKCWYNPIAARSLSDFWGNRWNRIMSGLMRDVIFLPLARQTGATVAMFVVFLFSGVMHEVFSFAAGTGYGRPTLYFLIQGIGVWVEGRPVVRHHLRASPWLGSIWTALIVLGPLGFLVTRSFIESAFVPMLREANVPGLPE